MSINAGKVTIGFADKNGELVLVLLRDDSNQLNLLQWPMRRLEPEGYHALCQHLGDSVLRMLAIAHPDEFAKFPSLAPPLREIDGPHGLIDALIARCYKEQTTEYVAVIDRLVERNTVALSETAMAEVWQAARLQILEIFAPDPAS